MEQDHVKPKYKCHEFADLYPMMENQDLEDLAKSIRSSGLQEDIILFEDKILDGRHREIACGMAGVEPRYTHFDGIRQEAFQYVVAMNERRRHLSSSQRAAIAIEKEEIFRAIEQANQDVKAKSLPQKGEKGFQSRSSLPQQIEEHKREPDYDRETAAKIAKANKTNRQYVRDAQEIKKRDPNILAQIKNGEKTITEVKKEFKMADREILRQQRDARAKTIKLPDNIEIYHSDCVELSQSLQDNSVDAIITDPPYPYEHLDCWSKLGQIGSAKLKPGGFCVAYTGKLYLPEVMRRMGEHLDYFWLIALTVTGQPSKTFIRSVIEKYKTIIVYYKPPIEDNLLRQRKQLFGDLIIGSGREKADHPWQQAVDELKPIVETFTEPGNTVLDPFAGSGSTLIMAQRMGRHAIGYEIELEHVNTTKARLVEDMEK